MSQGVLIDVPAHKGIEDNDHRYTTAAADLWLRSKAKVDEWDIDVAACAESHRAHFYYSAERGEDGVGLAWAVPRIFCNPPWSDIEPWVKRAFRLFGGAEADVEVIGMLLPGGRTHRPWWQKWIEPFRDRPPGWWNFRLETHYPPERFSYGGPGNPRGIGTAEPNFTTVGLVWRRS